MDNGNNYVIKNYLFPIWRIWEPYSDGRHIANRYVDMQNNGKKITIVT